MPKKMKIEEGRGRHYCTQERFLSASINCIALMTIICVAGGQKDDDGDVDDDFSFWCC